MKVHKLTILLAASTIFFITLVARQKEDTLDDVAEIISQKRYDEAERMLDGIFLRLMRGTQADTIADIAPLYAEIAYARGGIQAVHDTMASFAHRVSAINSSPQWVYHAYSGAAEYYSRIGRPEFGYENMKAALDVVMRSPRPDATAISKIEYNLGVYSMRLSRMQEAEQHHRKSLQMRLSEPRKNPENLYASLNSLGAVMWYSAKYDSATHYYSLAIEQLDKMPPDPVNKYYRRGILLNNLAGLYSQQGKFTEAVRAQEECVRINQLFLNDKEPHPKKTDAESGLYQGIDNLAGLFKDLGDYKKNGELLHYSYEFKKKRLKPGHSDIFISEVLLGQHYTDIREYEKAIEYLKQAFDKMDEATGDYLFWEADACYAMARSLDGIGQKEGAKEYYEKGLEKLETAYEGQYDNAFLDFIRNASLFWAANGEFTRARKATEKAYQYVLKVQGPNSLEAFYQLLNLSEIHQTAGQYRESFDYATRGLRVLEQNVKQAANRFDSVRMELYAPKAILMQSKARYELAEKRDTILLASIAVELEKAIEILERRKFLVDDPQSINILMAENAALLEFARKIEMERYRLTGRASLLDRFINLHESSLYTRIRNRLDKASDIRFANVPDSVFTNENRLKAAISASLGKKGDASLDGYFAALVKWNAHLENIRVEYPDYYAMRYASLTRDWSNIQENLSVGQTVIRYYFVDDSLFALVVNRDERRLVSLPVSDLESRITELYQYQSQEQVPVSALLSLYRDLWAPLESHIKDSNVLIVPDGILFALSFDMLPRSPINSYNELATKGLLSQYAISYQYSLFLVGRDVKTRNPDRNYIAFVPGFDEKAKNNYRKQVPDTFLLDQEYLRLLSQPNTRVLARALSRQLGGRAFTDENSTLSQFRQSADGHKIVHIGTHAEYDNMRPDQSRLIFSKEGGNSDNNALYLRDIYACRVQSDLTILTACESGKPGYQDGEGMVSLAHAFNYAGSQNILMGLWKIDEKSSSRITESMIGYIRQGLTAAEALRRAKLDYLSSSPGRTLAPAYWAGLVLMGDAERIAFMPSSPQLLWYIIPGIILLTGAFLWWRQRQRKSIH